MNDVNLENRVKEFEKEFIKLVAKYKLKHIILAEFPIYKILPPEVELAIKIINNHGVQYRLNYLDNPIKK